MYDVLIVGAGPAGAILAKELGLRRKVLLVDARPMGAIVHDFDYKGESLGFKDKCCGGLLAPDAKKWLVQNKRSLPISTLDGIQPDGLRAIDLGTSLERVYPTGYINLSRAAFEQWLLSLVPNDVDTLYEHRLIGISRTKHGFEVVLKTPEGLKLTHNCKILVGADGANSRVRRFLGKDAPNKSQYIAVQDVFSFKMASSISGPDLLKEYVAIFHPDLTDFYGWIIPKSDRIILGMAMPPRVRERKQAGAHMSLLKEYLGNVGYDFGGEFKREGCIILRPSVEQICLGENGAYLIGEAAGFISPSSAEGYSYAFISATKLAKSILKQNNPSNVMHSYQLACIPLQANIIYKQMKLLIMYSPLCRHMIMHSGLLANV